MPEGDILAVFTGLLFFAGGTGVTAYVTGGPKSRNLWIFTGFLVALAFAWWAWSAKLPIAPATALNILWLSIPLVTVVLVTALVKDWRHRPAETEKIPTPAVNSNRSVAIYNARVAVRNARMALADGRSDRAAEKALPSVKAAMLTFTKEFSVRFPGETGKPQVDLELFCRIIDEMLPYISANHDDAAYEVGEKWIRGIEEKRQ